MGYNRPTLDMVYTAVRNSIAEIKSPYNDGFTSSYCKQDLYMLKCWLEIEYSKLPTFAGEEKWEQNRIVEILKQ
jgi:hypothetical protein